MGWTSLGKWWCLCNPMGFKNAIGKNAHHHDQMIRVIMNTIERVGDHDQGWWSGESVLYWLEGGVLARNAPRHYNFTNIQYTLYNIQYTINTKGCRLFSFVEINTTLVLFGKKLNWFSFCLFPIWFDVIRIIRRECIWD